MQSEARRELERIRTEWYDAPPNQLGMPSHCRDILSQLSQLEMSDSDGLGQITPEINELKGSIERTLAVYTQHNMNNQNYMGGRRSHRSRLRGLHGLHGTRARSSRNRRQRRITQKRTLFTMRG